MAWVWFAVYLTVAVVAYAMVPKPKTQTQPPAGLGDFKVPTAEEGREIPVLFGTRDIDAPNVVWYGDLRTVAIRKKGGKK